MKGKNKIGMMMAVMMGKKATKMTAPKATAPKAVYKKTTVKKMK